MEIIVCYQISANFSKLCIHKHIILDILKYAHNFLINNQICKRITNWECRKEKNKKQVIEMYW